MRLLLGDPFPRYREQWTISPAIAKTLLTPLTLVDGKPDTMLLPLWLYMSKAGGGNFTTVSVTALGVEWTNGEGAMMLGSPGHYLFDEDESQCALIQNINNGGAPYFFASSYHVRGHGLSAKVRGANLGGDGVPLTFMMEWLEVPTAL